MKSQTKRALAILLLFCFLGSMTVTTVSAANTKKGFCIDLEKATLQNDYFRHVIYSGWNSQIVLMSLNPLEDIGMETHDDLDQFFYFMDGKGKCVVNGNEYKVRDGFCLFVPAGAEHNIINTMKNHDLKIFTTYSPPHHKDGIIRVTKKDAENFEEFVLPTELP